MKATRKLIPAIALLLVSAVLLSTASFAWFTTNKVVNTDMTVSVTAPQNLQISKDGTNYASYADFTPYTEVEGVKTPVYTKLTPVSSKDGKNFVLVKGLTLDQDGVLDQDLLDDVVDGTEDGEITKVTSATNAGETYYLQYDFKLKATQPIASADFIIEVKLNAKGTDTATTEAYKNAIRVFIFQNGTLVNTVGGTGAKPIVATTVGEETTYTVETAIDNAQSVAAFKGNVPQDWSIVIWVEGNDPACISGNIDADPDIDVDVIFSIKETP